VAANTFGPKITLSDFPFFFANTIGAYDSKNNQAVVAASNERLAAPCLFSIWLI